jgi:dGTPase
MADSPEDVRAHSARLAVLTEPAATTNRQLKRFLHARVYDSPALVEERRRAAEKIATLFRLYLDQPDRLPMPYAQLARVEPPHRVICDYIAGMTDGFFQRTWSAL